jgi:hypothetical protein
MEVKNSKKNKTEFAAERNPLERFLDFLLLDIAGIFKKQSFQTVSCNK